MSLREKDLRERFAGNLRRLRRDSKFSQEKLANFAGVDRAHVSKIERKIAFVGLEIIGRFSVVLDVEPAEFFRPLPKAPRRRSKE